MGEPRRERTIKPMRSLATYLGSPSRDAMEAACKHLRRTPWRHVRSTRNLAPPPPCQRNFGASICAWRTLSSPKRCLVPSPSLGLGGAPRRRSPMRGPRRLGRRSAKDRDQFSRAGEARVGISVLARKRSPTPLRSSRSSPGARNIRISLRNASPTKMSYYPHCPICRLHMTMCAQANASLRHLHARQRGHLGEREKCVHLATLKSHHLS